MKKYRNIKSGLVATESTNNSYNIDDSEFFRIPSSVIEDSNEWELIKDKLPYEIVSLRIKNIYCDAILTFNSEGVCTHRTDNLPLIGTSHIDVALKAVGVKVNSIKRLADGTIFNIGDKLVWNWSRSPVDYFVLKSFRLRNGEVHLEFKNSAVFEGIFESKIFNLRHYEEESPLFTTADGVKVYKNRHPKLYWVNKNDFRIGFDHINSLSDPDYINYIYFSEQHKAFNYLVSNKPVFSLNDVKRIIGSKQYYKEFKEFAKKACGFHN